jgi:hypothetical protein
MLSRFRVFFYKLKSLTTNNPTSFQLTGDWTQVDLIQLPNDPNSGLGFGIVGGASTGVVIKTILPGSAADKVS